MHTLTGAGPFAVMATLQLPVLPGFDYLLGIAQVLFPRASIPEIPEVFLEPDLKVECTHLWMGRAGRSVVVIVKIY